MIGSINPPFLVIFLIRLLILLPCPKYVLKQLYSKNVQILKLYYQNQLILENDRLVDKARAGQTPHPREQW